MEKTIVGICYDFDGTLTDGNMQEYSFIPKLGMTNEEYWDKADKLEQREEVGSILGSLKFMVDICKEHGIKLTKEYLAECGKAVKFYPGVETWFKRLDEYAEKKGLILEHYIISSGNREILEGCSIFKEMKRVYASEFLFNKEGEAYWPKVVMDFTLKTQYIFRICKGIYKLTDEEKINQKVSKRRIELKNMIYIGDGITDIPCMKLIKNNGGTSISVYTEAKKQISQRLLDDNRVNFACKSDYREGEELDTLVKLVIDSIALRVELANRELKQI